MNAGTCQRQRSSGRPRIELDETACRTPIHSERNVGIRICFDTGQMKPAWLWIAGGPNGLQNYDVTVCVIWHVPTIHERAALWTNRVKVTHAMHPLLWSWTT
jgi:hypothetical protein